jgi:hypothetical protein
MEPRPTSSIWWSEKLQYYTYNSNGTYTMLFWKKNPNHLWYKSSWPRRRTIPKDISHISTHLFIMLVGHWLKPISDKPLLSAKLLLRLEQMRMKTQNVDFVWIHIPGKLNITDYLSRHPLPDTEETHLD